MGSYLLFVVIAVATVLSPGPGVMLTLTNAIRFGVSGAVGRICRPVCPFGRHLQRPGCRHPLVVCAPRQISPWLAFIRKRGVLGQ